MTYNNPNLDDLLNVLSMEELAILADEPTIPQINITDSTINIYTTEQKRTTATPYDDTPCPECQQAYCICDQLDQTEDNSDLPWYAYPIWIMPLVGAIEITKGVWSLGKHLIFADDNNETVALPQEIDTTEIIDTEIVEDSSLSEYEIQQQIALYKQATEEPLSEESQHYTNLFRKAIA